MINFHFSSFYWRQWANCIPTQQRSKAAGFPTLARTLLEKQDPASVAPLSRFSGRENYVLVQEPEAPFLSVNQASHFLPHKVASRWWTTLAVLWWLPVWGGGPPGWQFHVAWDWQRERVADFVAWLEVVPDWVPKKGWRAQWLSKWGKYTNAVCSHVWTDTPMNDKFFIEYGDLYMLPCL